MVPQCPNPQGNGNTSWSLASTLPSAAGREETQSVLHGCLKVNLQDLVVPVNLLRCSIIFLTFGFHNR